MSERSGDPVVRCRFDNCDASTILEVTLAVVDQVGAAVDADIAVLEALDYPLSDGIEALFEHDIEMIEVSEVSGVVRVDVHVGRPPTDFRGAFGDAQDAIETFFDVTFPHTSVVRMAGSLR